MGTGTSSSSSLCHPRILQGCVSSPALPGWEMGRIFALRTPKGIRSREPPPKKSTKRNPGVLWSFLHPQSAGTAQHSGDGGTKIPADIPVPPSRIRETRMLQESSRAGLGEAAASEEPGEIPRAEADLHRLAASSQPANSPGFLPHPHRTVPVSPELGTPVGARNSCRVQAQGTADPGCFVLSILLGHPGFFLRISPTVLGIQRVSELGIHRAAGLTGIPRALRMQPPGQEQTQKSQLPQIHHSNR